jgi:acyl-CoA synthetase (NDP forming)
MGGVLVQAMIGGGTEVLVGMTHDPLFGALVAFGLGGIHVEILVDVCFRVTPLIVDARIGLKPTGKTTETGEATPAV